MTAVSFLNHIDKRVNPYTMSEVSALRLIHQRNLFQRFRKMQEQERRFLNWLEGK